MKIPLIVIVGPTAVGKTKLSIELAKAINGEIISGDAIQVYKGMDIGSAKITAEEAEGIPHHLIDILEPNESYSSAQFKNEAEKCIESIYSRGKIPMVVGGTGLYIQSLLYEYDYLEEDPKVKQYWISQYEHLDRETLHEQLKSVDPIAAASIHPNNKQRVLRALTYYKMHQQSITLQSKSKTISDKYDTILIGLNMPRPILYHRINERVQLMFEQGLINEVKHLLDSGFESAQSMTAIGYKEVIPFIKGEITYDTMVESLQQNTRHFAKRQLTWFNNQMNIDWLDPTELSVADMVNHIQIQIKGE